MRKCIVLCVLIFAHVLDATVTSETDIEDADDDQTEDETVDDVDDDYEYDDYDEFDSLSNNNGAGLSGGKDIKNGTAANVTTLHFIRELRNVTRDAGKTVKFRCEVGVSGDITATTAGGERVRFIWRQNQVALPTERRFRINENKKGDRTYISTLRITHLDHFDRGFYTCIAQKGTEKIRKEVYLDVIHKWNVPPHDLPNLKNTGLRNEMTTLVTHHHHSPHNPTDSLPTLLTDQPALPALHEQTIHNPRLFESAVPINHQSTTTTTTITTLPGIISYNNNNDNLQQQQQQQRYAAVAGPVVSATVAAVVTASYNSSQPFCQRYSGRVCAHLLADRYVFVQPPLTQETIEENLSQTLVVVSQSNDMSVGCSNYALPSLCYSAFPLCSDHAQVNRYQRTHINRHRILNGGDMMTDNGRLRNLRTQLTMFLQRICKRDCTLLVTEVCNKEYAIAKRHPVIGQTVQLEECHDLPDDTDDVDVDPYTGSTTLSSGSTTGTVSCVRLYVEGARDVDPSDTCYWDEGRGYRGAMDVVVGTGERCMRWGHLQLSLSDYPELMGHNYCRNPGGLEPEPYCYTDPNRRQPCGLPRCARILYTYLGGATLILLLLLTFAITLYCCKRHSSSTRNARNIAHLQLNTADKNIYGNGNGSVGSPGVAGGGGMVEMNALLPGGGGGGGGNTGTVGREQRALGGRGGQHGAGLQQIPQYGYSDLQFVEELGEGAFGKVYKGRIKPSKYQAMPLTPGSTPHPSSSSSSSNNSHQHHYVAVKALKENASAKTQADFQREIELIAELRHPNIICLVGVVRPARGSPHHCMLFEYMELGDLHQFLVGGGNGGGGTGGITQHQCLQVALQIAQGMEYLADNHYVHRDLAARNCLVSHQLIVKISDFGLSRDMYSCDYYRVQSKSLLPVRWMPPESILYGKFTTESDVWSYGVVLWEVYSYGLQPYYGYNNQEVINMIRSRKLLPCPDSCPGYCYALMVECWAELAVRRPNFKEICHRLRIWKQNGIATGAYFRDCSKPTNSGGGGATTSDSGTCSALGHPTGGGGGYSGGGGGSDTLPLHHHHHHPPLSQPPTPLNHPAAAVGGNTSQSGTTVKYGGGGGGGGASGGSQTSLTSRCSSSLGNRTQSTNLSDATMQQQQHQGGSTGRRKSQQCQQSQRWQQQPQQQDVRCQSTMSDKYGNIS